MARVGYYTEFPPHTLLSKVVAETVACQSGDVIGFVFNGTAVRRRRGETVAELFERYYSVSEALRTAKKYQAHKMRKDLR